MTATCLRLGSGQGECRERGRAADAALERVEHENRRPLRVAPCGPRGIDEVRQTSRRGLDGGIDAKPGLAADRLPLVPAPLRRGVDRLREVEPANQISPDQNGPDASRIRWSSASRIRAARPAHRGGPDDQPQLTEKVVDQQKSLDGRVLRDKPPSALYRRLLRLSNMSAGGHNTPSFHIFATVELKTFSAS